MDVFDHEQIDDLIHSRIRLPVMAMLATTPSLEFTQLRNAVNTTDGNLGMHLRKLEEAEYVDVEKTFVGRKPVTRYTLSARGRVALQAYARHLTHLLASVRQPAGH